MSAVPYYHERHNARPRVELLESRRLLSGGRGEKARELFDAVITMLMREYEVVVELPKVETPAAETPPPEVPVSEAPMTESPASELPMVEPPASGLPIAVIEQPTEQPTEVEVIAPPAVEPEAVPPVEIEPVGVIWPEGGDVIEVVDVEPTTVGEIVDVIPVEVPIVPVSEVEVTLPGIEDDAIGGEDVEVVQNGSNVDEVLDGDGVFGQEPIGDFVEEIVDVAPPFDAGSVVPEQVAERPIVEPEFVAPQIVRSGNGAPEIATAPPPVSVRVVPLPTRAMDEHSWQDAGESVVSRPVSRPIAAPAPEVMPAVTLVRREARETPESSEAPVVEPSTTAVARDSAAPSGSTGQVSEQPGPEVALKATVAAPVAPASASLAPASASLAPGSASLAAADTPIAEALVDVQPVVNGEEAVTDASHPVLGKMLRNAYGRVAGSDNEPAPEPRQAPRVVRQEVEAEEEDSVVVAEPMELRAELAANTEAGEHAAADGAAEHELAMVTPVPTIAPELQPEQLPPPVAAAIVTPADSASSTVRNVVAALAVGTAVGLVQLHQWRKRKLAEAASKLASLLSFDPLAVWLDEDDRQRNR